jgi:serine/threonine protein kinase
MQGIYATLLEVALALRHLHAQNLLHRDLKPANLLLKSNPNDPRGWNAKLADFGKGGCWGVCGFGVAWCVCGVGGCRVRWSRLPITDCPFDHSALLSSAQRPQHRSLSC